MLIQGQGALVTGASRGLGRALAEQLAAKGARVALVAREAGPLHDLVAQIRSAGGVAHAVVGDISDKAAVHKIERARVVNHQAELADEALRLSRGPVPLRLLLDTECEDLQAVLDTNLVGPFRLTKILAGAMALRGSGTIVHISSDAAIEAYPRWGAYSISKAAQDHLSRILAAELADTGVRILALDPGEMDTRMHADAIPDADRTTLQQPREVAANLIAMLETDVPTGTRLAVSGRGTVTHSTHFGPQPSEIADRPRDGNNISGSLGQTRGER